MLLSIVQGIDTKVIAFDFDMGGEIDFLCQKQNKYSVRFYGDDTFGSYIDILPYFFRRIKFLHINRNSFTN